MSSLTLIMNWWGGFALRFPNPVGDNSLFAFALCILCYTVVKCSPLLSIQLLWCFCNMMCSLTVFYLLQCRFATWWHLNVPAPKNALVLWQLCDVEWAESRLNWPDYNNNPESGDSSSYWWLLFSYLGKAITWLTQ